MFLKGAGRGCFPIEYFFMPAVAYLSTVQLEKATKNCFGQDYIIRLLVTIAI